jgi:hypothetical protein
MLSPIVEQQPIENGREYEMQFKIITILLVMIILTSCVTGQPLSGMRYKAYGLDYLFFDAEVEIRGYGVNQDMSGRYPYSIEYRYGIPFLVIDKNSCEEYVALFNDTILYLYDGDRSDPVYIGHTLDPSFLEIDGFGQDWYSFMSSSFYQQPSETYPPENLGNFQLFQPWVEGSEGNGIGDYIVIEDALFFITISNGFVSYDRPELYEQNGRVRELLIEHLESGDSVEVELIDSPNPQIIDLPNGDEQGDYKITILSVYEGTKYQDVSINFID